MFSNFIAPICRFRLLLLVAMISFSSGCCVYPLQDDKGPDFNRSFYGATLNPEETVEFQAKNRDGQWEVFHSVKTSNIPLRGWGGIDYYVWNCFDLAIPSKFWRDTHGISINVCEIRVIDSAGENLYTYNEPWTNDDLFSNPLEVWNARGNREDSLRLWQHREF